MLRSLNNFRKLHISHEIDALVKTVHVERLYVLCPYSNTEHNHHNRYFDGIYGMFAEDTVLEYEKYKTTKYEYIVATLITY